MHQLVARRIREGSLVRLNDGSLAHVRTILGTGKGARYTCERGIGCTVTVSARQIAEIVRA